jgi:hypothetical protein
MKLPLMPNNGLSPTTPFPANVRVADNPAITPINANSITDFETAVRESCLCSSLHKMAIGESRVAGDPTKQE